MAGFLDVEDYGFLVGATLDRVTISNMVALDFKGRRRIEVFGELEHHAAETGEISRYVVEDHSPNFNVQTLLGIATTEVTAESEDRLVVLFANGDRIVIVRRPEFIETAMLYGIKDGKAYPVYVVE